MYNIPFEISDNESNTIEVVFIMPDQAMKRPESLIVFPQNEYPEKRGLSRVPPA